MKDFERFIGKILRFKWDPKKRLKKPRKQVKKLEKKPVKSAP